jgi:hypothetical protein
MISRAETRKGQFVEVGWSFHGVLLGSCVFFLTPRRSGR